MQQTVAPPPPPPPRGALPKPAAAAVDSSSSNHSKVMTVCQQRDENDYIEPQMVVDNMFDDVLIGSLDSKVSLP